LQYSAVFTRTVTTPSVVNKVRVAHLVSHPIQYFVPLYRSLANRPEIDLTVFFCCGASLGEHFDRGFGRYITWDVPLAEGYHYHVSSMASKRHPLDGFDWRLDMSIIRRLVQEQYDIIWLHGRMSLHAWFAMFYGRFKGIPVFLRDDANLLVPRSVCKRILKRTILPLFYRNIIGLAVSRSNQTFFKHYGTGIIFPCGYAVDNRALQARHNTLRKQRSALRASFGVEGDEPLILFCGKLIAHKCPELLLEAFSTVRNTTRCSLLFVGDGQLKRKLEESVSARNIPNVHFVGFLNQTELPNAYASADLMVLPSSYKETWGLVVNEAMNFGLPVIVSDHVGCADDLVKNRVNGLVFESGNLEALVSCLNSLIGSAPVREAYGKNSLKAVAAYSLEESTKQIVTAFTSVLAATAAGVHQSAAS
jgi:glycosyltransferase involved in cell wall biosynthesis